jgi:hypothetical protein
LQTLKTVAPYIALLFSGLSLVLAYNISRAYSRRQLLNKQIETVTELIKSLHRDYIEINFSKFVESGDGSSGAAYTATIFEVVELSKNLKEINERFCDSIVLFKGKCNQVLDIKDYIDNPFTPKTIADNLLGFYSTSYVGAVYSEVGTTHYECVQIQTNNNEPTIIQYYDEKDHFIHGNAIALRSWESFIVCSENLKRSIEDWFSENGVKDLNIRVDFKQIGLPVKGKKIELGKYT